MTDTITDKRERGYFQVDNEIIENYQLSPYSGWLYCVISKYASKSGEAFPSLNTLAKEANMSKPAIIKHMAELEKRNLIRVRREKINAKKNAVNHYFLQSVVKNSHLELLQVVNEVDHVVNEVDRNKTQVNKTKEKDFSAKIAEGSDSLSKTIIETCAKCGGEYKPYHDGDARLWELCECWAKKINVYVMADDCSDCHTRKVVSSDSAGLPYHLCFADMPPGDKCVKCKYEYRWLFDANNTKHRVCNCTTDEDMRKAGFVEHDTVDDNDPDELPDTAGLEVCNGCANLNGGQCSYYDFDTTTQPYFGQKCGGYKAAQKVIVRHEGGSEVGFTPQEQAIMDDSGKELRRQLGVVDWLPMHDHAPLIVICPDCTEVIHEGTCLCDNVPLTLEEALSLADDVKSEIEQNIKDKARAEAEYNAPLVTGDSLGTDPFADKNDPANPPTPLIPEDKLPEINGTRFSFGVNGTIEKSPITTDDKPKRLVTREQDEPIAQTPANLKAAPVETSQVMPEAAPKKAAKKAKTKPKYSKEQRDAMKAAVLDAVGWLETDVESWGLITRVVNKKLAKGCPVELIAEWRDWNNGLDFGKSQNPGALIGSSWGTFMKSKREQAARPATRQPQELRIEVDEEYL